MVSFDFKSRCTLLEIPNKMRNTDYFSFLYCKSSHRVYVCLVSSIPWCFDDRCDAMLLLPPSQTPHTAHVHALHIMTVRSLMCTYDRLALALLQSLTSSLWSSSNEKSACSWAQNHSCCCCSSRNCCA